MSKKQVLGLILGTVIGIVIGSFLLYLYHTLK